MQRDSAAGRLVGRYVVHHCIAAGGMATVHLARLLGAGGFSRVVAIKRLHEPYARDPEFVAMLLDEARLASTIRHPNVVPTLDVVAEQSELLVVMEYVEGDSLAHLARLACDAGERVPAALAAAVVAQALHGLHAAHDARDEDGAPLGIVHRDVSPQNVLVGVDGVARVLDFGIAKAASRATSTEDGKIKGKIAYMAPEQLQQAAVDRRTDVFASAVMLWELLAGRHLFRGDTPAETMSRALRDRIDSPQRWAPELDPALSAITMRGLERDPDGRFSTAEEMALALEDAIALPRPKEIGAWVARVAERTLAARAELAGEIARAAAPSQGSEAADTELRAALDQAERRRQVSELPTDVGARSGEPDASARPPRLSAVAGVVGGIALAAALVVVLAVREPPVARAEEPPAPSATAAEAAPMAEAAGAGEAPEPPPPLASAVAASAPEPSASASTSRVKRRVPAARGGSSRGSGSDLEDCSMPYVVDAKGLKHFKVQCL